jgi:membrane-associated protease RseP (regulator of RpoE activity)
LTPFQSPLSASASELRTSIFAERKLFQVRRLLALIEGIDLAWQVEGGSMLRPRTQLYLWFLAAALCITAVVSEVGFSVQGPAGARPTFSVPLQPNQQVGVIVQDITPAIASTFGIKEDHGAVVTALDIGALQAGDVILSVNGRNVSNRRTLETVLAEIPPTEALVFQVSRNGSPHDVVIQKNTSAAAPSEDHSIPPALAPGFRGVRVEVSTGRFNDVSGLAVTGLAVTAVDRGTPAEAAGLRIGDIIVDVNQVPVQNVDQFFDYVEKLRGQRVNLGVVRQGIYSVVIVPSFY